MPISIIVHGGAGNDFDDRVDVFERGVTRSVQAGWSILKNGGTALDAVEAAVRVMEDDPTFDAGTGSYLNTAGEVEMDAFIMDGATLNNGAVAGIQRVKNPISVARIVMEHTPHSLFVGTGAETLARQFGVPVCPMEELVAGSSSHLQGEDLLAGMKPQGLDTVGAIALDESGSIAAAISTGGTNEKMPGRVGDSPLIGCGAYADGLLGAACGTGRGEDLMKILFAKTALDRMASGLNPQEAADSILATLNERVQGEGGIILMNMRGEVGSAYNTHHMVHAWINADGEMTLWT